MSSSNENINAAEQLDLSFVVETVNTPPGEYERLWASLANQSAQTLERNRYEIVVVVDTLVHPELPGRLARDWPDVRIVPAPGKHYYAQKNLGAREARGRIIGFVDSDCQASPGWAENVRELFARRGHEIGAVQAVYTGFDGAQEKAFAIAIFSQCLSGKEENARALGTSNCAFLRTSLLETPFEEAPFFHGPDVRLFGRLKAAGRPVVYCPGATVRHRFDRGLDLFWQRGLSWGYCFLELRKDVPPNVQYARAFKRLGLLGPVVLAPAKAVFDVRRLFAHRRLLGLGPAEAVGSTAVLVLHALAVGVGAVLFKLGRPAPVAPY